jgi:predicted AAA+ superfamily ATPase
MTVHDYLDYITDAYLAFRVPLFSESLRKVESNPKKIYGIDTGLVQAFTVGFSKNLGHYFENLVYIDLRRKGHEVYYYLTTSRREVDFLSKDPLGNWHLNQVCWDLSDPQALDREHSALEEAEKELGIKGKIMTPDSYFTSFL